MSLNFHLPSSSGPKIYIRRFFVNTETLHVIVCAKKVRQACLQTRTHRSKLKNTLDRFDPRELSGRGLVHKLFHGRRWRLCSLMIPIPQTLFRP